MVWLRRMDCCTCTVASKLAGTTWVNHNPMRMTLPKQYRTETPVSIRNGELRRLNARRLGMTRQATSLRSIPAQACPPSLLKTQPKSCASLLRPDSLRSAPGRLLVDG